MFYILFTVRSNKAYKSVVLPFKNTAVVRLLPFDVYNPKIHLKILEGNCDEVVEAFKQFEENADLLVHEVASGEAPFSLATSTTWLWKKLAIRLSERSLSSSRYIRY